MKVTSKHVFFYVEWPSNFWHTQFSWEAFGEKHSFFCTEQAFMWAKAMLFNDKKAAAEILKPLSAGNTPMLCKKLGRLVKRYDDKQWALARYGFMLQANLCKYRQDLKLQEKLMDHAFDSKTFVEASPIDKIWGIGLPESAACIDDESCWKGTNLLGKVITEARRTIAYERECRAAEA